jgi:hypothetical protein
MLPLRFFNFLTNKPKNSLAALIFKTQPLISLNHRASEIDVRKIGKIPHGFSMGYFFW